MALSVYGVSVPLVRCLLRLKYTKIRFEGLENIPRIGGAVFVANHLVLEDSFLIGIGVWQATHRPVTFGAKDEYFSGHWHGPLIGRFVKWYFEKIHQVPVYRDHPRAFQLLEEVLTPVLQNGGLVVLHAESTRSPDGKLYKFATGPSRLGRDNKVSLIPVALVYTNHWFFGHTATIKFGAPLHPKEHRLMPIPELTDNLRKRVQAMSKQVYENVSARAKKKQLEEAKFREEEVKRRGHKP